MEVTVAMVKPGAVEHLQEILNRITTVDLSVVYCRRVEQLPLEVAEGLYQEHAGKPFFPTLIEYTVSGPVYLLVLTGPHAVQDWRRLMGSRSEPESLRGRFSGPTTADNAVHGSDSVEAATRELQLITPLLE
jgi:nucleoside-diphosphate kinase